MGGRRQSFTILTTVALVLGACHDPSSPSGRPSDQVPQLSLKPRLGERIPGQYIVVFRNDVRDVKATAKAIAGKHRGKLKHTYQAALKGMAIELPDTSAAALRSDPAVQYVEQNQVFRAIAEPVVQPNATIGLDRIDQRSLPLSGTYTYSADGTGVRVYIIDTGIKFDHTDFGGRAVLGMDAIGSGGVDCNGHGTHVAGTVGGTKYGVAKKAKLYAVRVLDCGGSGETFQVLDGIEWVTANRVLPAVANMSLGGPPSAALNQAVTNSIASGVTYAVAAGNSRADACEFSPSSTPNALTVAASDRNDSFVTEFSNYGPCVDLVAPGKAITSDWIGSSTATNTLDGTSMASPHVAGAAALYLSTFPNAKPDLVTIALTGNATQGVLTSVPAGTKNRLLYTNFLDQDPPASAWASQASLIVEHSALALGSAKGRLYAIGGQSSFGTVITTVEEFDPISNSWRRKTPLPAARYDGSGAWPIAGLLYAPGGRNASGTLTRTLYAYNLAANSWTTKAPLPIAGGCGGSAGISQQLYVLTGCTATGFKGLLHRYNPSTNSWTARASAPAPHGYPAFGVLGGKLYVAGGKNAAGAPTRTLHVYTPATNSWTTKAPMPSARFGAAGQVINGKFYVVGGNGGTADLSSILVYDPATNAWSTKEPMPTPRRSLGAGVINGLLYAVGGRVGTTDLRVTERFTP
jgi:subtilisin family serine protease